VRFPPCILPLDDIFGRFLESDFNIAVATGRTVYDSIYLALATALGCKLVTADQRLYKALQGGPFAADVLLGGRPDLRSPDQTPLGYNGEDPGAKRAREPIAIECEEGETMAIAGQQPPQVFISYNRTDRKWLERLQVFLKPLERQRVVERWDDTRLRTGERWHDEIEKALASAQVAVLLVSADFLASDFIANEELPALLAAEQARGLVVMPVIVSPCRFAKTPSLAQFTAVNYGLKSLEEMNEGEQAALLTRLTDDIEEAIKRPR